MQPKSLFLTILCTCIFTFGYSQTEKGSLLIGGTFNVGVSNVNDNSLFNFSLNPNIGVFVLDNLSVGSALGVQVQSAENFTNSSFSLVPEVRYYFPPFADDKVYAFAVGGIGFITSRTNFDLSSIANESDSGYLTNLGVGLAYFVAENVALEAIFRHNFTKFNDDLTGITNLGLVGGVQVYIGK